MIRKISCLCLCASLAWACTTNKASEAEQTEGSVNIIEIEAENGDFRAPFQAEPDQAASGGKYIWVPNYSSVLSFNVGQQGTYKIWGRVLCPTGGEDSYNMRLDDGDPFNWNNIEHSDTWIWDEVHGKEGVKTLDLSPGQHSLKLRSREDVSRLDRILVTNDMAYTPEGNPEADFAPTEGKEYVWMEAETGQIKPPFYVEAHHTASGNEHISVPAESSRFKVDIPANGTYRIFAKLNAKAGDENSIKFRVGDEGAFSNWHAVPPGKFNQWVWEEVDLDKKTEGVTHFDLEKGPTSIWIKYREEGLKIDKFIITDDMDFQPNEAQASES